MEHCHSNDAHYASCVAKPWVRQHYLQSSAGRADTIAMQRLAIHVTGVMLASIMAFAQEPTGGGPGPVLGIVEIPEMFFVDDDKGTYAPRAALTIYSRPDSESKVLAVISSPEAIDEARYTSERAGALVYRRERGYFLIRTARGVGWLSPHNAGSFHPLEELIRSELAYLTHAWDGFVSASPESADRTRVGRERPLSENDSKNVRVRGFRTVGGKLWVAIEVISHTFCQSNEPPTTEARGWIKAHDETGAPTVWFPSGGC